MNAEDSTFEVSSGTIQVHKDLGHIDQYDRLQSPSLHDGEFLGLLLNPSSSPGRTATLHAKTSQREAVRITLQGVESLAAQNFYEGNIICTMWVWALEAMPGEYWRILLRNRRAEADSFQKDRQRFLDTVPDAVCLAVSSSYGCELVAICASFCVEQAE